MERIPQAAENNISLAPKTRQGWEAEGVCVELDSTLSTGLVFLGFHSSSIFGVVPVGISSKNTENKKFVLTQSYS